jgi:hypothetical protein
MIGSIADAPNEDAFGRSLALAYGAALGLALVIVVAILLLVAAVNGSMSLWGKIGALILLPLAMVTMWMAGDAYGKGDRSAILVSALLPPLFLLYALRARVPSLRRMVGEGLANVVLGGADRAAGRHATGQGRDPAPPGSRGRGAGNGREARQEKEEQRQADEARARRRDLPRSIRPSLRDYRDLMGGDCTTAVALAGAWSHQEPQADAAALCRRARSTS